MSLKSLVGRVRGLVEPFFIEGDEQDPVQLTNNGEMIMVQGLPELAESARLGRIWQVASATGVAALTVLPTTTAGLSLWNGESGVYPKAYVIEAFGSVEEVIDATQADTTAMFACNNLTPVTAPTDAALTIRGTSGRKYGGKARTVAAGAIANDGWFAHGQQPSLAPAVAGANWKVNEVLVKGLYVVPPGGMFNVVAVKAAAAAALQQFYFIRWHEARLACTT